jgi:hypothetical protein
MVTDSDASALPAVLQRLQQFWNAGCVPPSGVGAVGNWPAAATAKSLA